MAVVFVNLLLEQLHPVHGPLQALVGAHDAHIVPHEAAQLLPVVGDHHVLVGIRDLAFIPMGRLHLLMGFVQLGANRRRRHIGED